MPVELPDGEPPEAAPAPPLAIVWLALFVAFMLAGVVSTLLTWPKTEPTGSAWFWMRLLGLPALAWCVAFGLRLHYYDEESERRRAEKEARQEDRDKALLFASEPLAVVGCAYLSAPGSEDLASKIAEGGPALKAQTSRAGSNAVRHTALDLLEDKNMPGRYRACFRELLNQVADAVTAVPRNVPLDVRLHLPADADRESLLDTWHACWGARDLRPVNATLLSSERGLMALDEWLDIRGGLSLEKFTLFVSIQLHDTPPQNSAEAAVALLLGWRNWPNGVS